MGMKLFWHTSLLLCLAISVQTPFLLSALAQEETVAEPAAIDEGQSEAEKETQVPSDESLSPEPVSEATDTPASSDTAVVPSDTDTSAVATDVVDSEGVSQESVMPEATDAVIDERTILTEAAIVEKETLAKEQIEEVKETLALASPEKGDLVLVSTTTFAMNVVPEFVFTTKQTEGFFEETLDAVAQTVTGLYEESFVESIVDTIIDAAQSVVEFMVPQAQGQSDVPEDTTVSTTVTEDVPATITPDEVPVETETEEVTKQDDAPLEDITTEERIEEVGAVQPETVEQPLVSNVTAGTSTASTSTILPPAIPYAVVDGVFMPVALTVREETITVRIEGVFSVGEHAVLLHTLHNEKEIVTPFIFTVQGSIVLEQPLFDTYSVLLTQDSAGFKTLWLADYASGTLRSLEKITDGVYVGEGTHYTFENQTLFWNIPALEVMMGYDVISKNMFSQTLTMHGSQKNFIDLEEGRAEIHIEDGAVDLTRVISATP